MSRRLSDVTSTLFTGEFDNTLLKVENKEKLFKAAAETGILDYDKSATMNVMCKRDPQLVRALLGLTNDNLLLNKVTKATFL